MRHYSLRHWPRALAGCRDLLDSVVREEAIVPRAAPAGAGRSARSGWGSSGSPPTARRCALLDSGSCGEQVYELVDGRAMQALDVLAQLEDRPLLPLGKAARQVGLEFLDQHRHAFLAAALMADWVFAHHFLELRAVLESDGERVGDRTLLRVVVVARKALVLDARNVFPQGVDPGILGDVVLIV